MKICRKGLEYVQTYDEKGTVRPCCYSCITDVGNLLENTMYEIYHGEKMEEFRNSLLDGSYRYCIREICPYIANNRLDEILVEYKGVPEYPKEINMAHDHTCNYRCACCRKEHFILNEQEKLNLEKIEWELSIFLDDVNIISSNGLGEVFASKTILKLLENYRPKRDDITVMIETNGSMFEEKWEKIKHLGKYNLHVCISILSLNDMTYRYLSGVNYDTKRIIKNINFVNKLREQGIINFFELATVMLERNFRQMPEFIKKSLEEFDPDMIRIRPFFPTGSNIPEIEWFNDVRNTYHPYHEEFKEVMENPIFRHPKVLMWSGNEPTRMGVHPGIRHRINYDTIRYLFEKEDSAKRVRKYFLENSINDIIVYGIGGIGKALVTILDEAEFPIKCIMDQYCKETSYRDHAIMLPSEFIASEKNYIVVAAPLEFEEIKKQLCGMGWENQKILNLSEIIQAIL